MVMGICLAAIKLHLIGNAINMSVSSVYIIDSESSIQKLKTAHNTNIYKLTLTYQTPFL